MARYIPQTSSGVKTYATEASAVKAMEKDLDQHPTWKELNVLIMQADNQRWVPVYVGMKAIELGVHFHRHVIC